MKTFLRNHAATVVVASVVAMVLGGVPALAHFTSISSHDVNHLDKDYTKTIYRRGDPQTVANGATDSDTVACPGGYVAMGGGAYTSRTNMYLEASYPTHGTSVNAGHTGWGTYVHNSSGLSGTFRVYVVCRRAFVNPGGYPANSLPAKSPETR